VDHVGSNSDLLITGGKMKVRDILQMIGKVLFIFLALLAIYMLLLKITGHSPTIDQVVLVLFSGIITAVVSLYGKITKLEGEFKHLNRKVDAIGSDLKEATKSIERIINSI